MIRGTLSADALHTYARRDVSNRARTVSTNVGPVLKRILQADTRVLDFGTLPIGTASTKTITFHNNGALPVTISAMELLTDGTQNNAMLHDNDFVFETNECSDHILLPAQSCAVAIVHQPTRGDVHQGQLRVTSDSLTPMEPITLQGRSVEVTGPTPAPTAEPTGSSGGGGVDFTPYWLMIALLTHSSIARRISKLSSRGGK